MSTEWQDVAVAFHERVRASCWDSLAGQLMHLHQPHIVNGQPVCRGCDRERTGDPDSDPTWPCRTYTIIASVVLGEPDVEGTLSAMGLL